MKLRELMELIGQYAAREGHPITAGIWEEIERAIMQAHPGERIYIPKANAGQKSDIIDAAKRLPSAVVAERFGVSRSWVNRLVRAGRK
jgi:hypothetical protein